MTHNALKLTQSTHPHFSNKFEITSKLMFYTYKGLIRLALP